jgi:hypothetical protein
MAKSTVQPPQHVHAVVQCHGCSHTRHRSFLVDTIQRTIKSIDIIVYAALPKVRR